MSWAEASGARREYSPREDSCRDIPFTCAGRGCHPRVGEAGLVAGRASFPLAAGLGLPWKLVLSWMRWQECWAGKT